MSDALCLLASSDKNPSQMGGGKMTYQTFPTIAVTKPSANNQKGSDFTGDSSRYFEEDSFQLSSKLHS